jgi:hypothetical protein
MMAKTGSELRELNGSELDMVSGGMDIGPIHTQENGVSITAGGYHLGVFVDGGGIVINWGVPGHSGSF